MEPESSVRNFFVIFFTAFVPARLQHSEATPLDHSWQDVSVTSATYRDVDRRSAMVSCTNSGSALATFLPDGGCWRFKYVLSPAEAPQQISLPPIGE